MRPIYLFLSLLCLLMLTACGSEEEITPPAFSNIKVNDADITPLPFKDPVVKITGNIDDFAATIVASTVSGKEPVTVNRNDGSWSYSLTLKKEGAHVVSFTASDQRGNINQLVLTVRYDATAPIVTAVTQSVDPSPQLIVTFKEKLLESSLATALFAVVNVDDTPLTGSLTGTLTAPNTVTLSLAAALPAGPYRLTCSGISDLATPDGNSVAVGYFFDFTIQ